jgi:hypothetical protein
MIDPQCLCLNTYYFGMDVPTWMHLWGTVIFVLVLLLIIMLTTVGVVIVLGNWWNMRPNARIKSNTPIVRLNHESVPASC